MKRHQSRLAPTVLTLSLLGAASLLTACGGGGGGGGEPAPAAPSTTPSEPTLTTETDPNEPYIVAPSNYESEFRSEYRLNVLDGLTQQVVKSIRFNGPLDYQWDVSTKIDRSKPDAAVILGSHTLFYIQSVGEQRHLFKMDLSKTSGSLTPVRISAEISACAIWGSYPIQKSGDATALIVYTGGSDNNCATESDNKNVIVSSADSTAQAGRTSVVQATDKILASLYRAGELKGMLVQRTSGLVGQLDIISPLQDKTLVSAVTYDLAGAPGINRTTYDVSPDKPEEGAEWIADEPGETGNGYLRIQQFKERSVPGLSKKLPASNVLYRLEWDSQAATPTARLIDQEYALQLNSLTNKGVTDGSKVYIPSGRYIIYGPDTSSAAESRFARLGDLGSLVNAPTIEMFSTEKHLAVIQTKGDKTTIQSMNKLTGVAINLVADATDLELYGIKTKLDSKGKYETAYLYAGALQVGGIHRNLIRYNLGGKPLEVLADPILPEAKVITPIWDKTIRNGYAELSDILLCTPTSVLSENCLDETLRTIDLTAPPRSTDPFKVTVGRLVNSDTNSISVSAVGSIAGRNGALIVDKLIGSGVKSRQDVWLFHPSVSNSLKVIETINLKAPATPTP
ncbi:MAG: hypothetical protein ACK4F8_08005 [Aquabacterium sp.]